ncbi:unnamed protein product (macronuclear) [Paramecium tetraurelia]|uniref:Uncharacterized protein n=1 Tax=Paramecium tetraurelia TaxID=5888 RepID=A0DWL9_PARTE|nr:uncharacterized protein GSPATT00021079001 [Paramecium tetraurelia]CAK87436.1 unnamed protein product [Paramecium tetraurelia]|eukprot:XP_001454833.1 hypothetical protein (macronuclear) [Paramecium tetraurelia strain d4-2]
MSWLFNKAQQPVQQPKLPSNFAEKVLNLELDVESNAASKEEIQELLQLYSQAVEHYSSIKSERYTVFTNKIQALLIKPYVNKMFGAEIKQESKQIQQQHVQKEQIKNNIQFIQQMDSNKQVQQMMTAAIDEKIKKENIIADDFKMQDHRVQQRMLNRIKDPSKYNLAISKSTSLRHLKLDIESQSQQSALSDALESGQEIRSDPVLDNKYLETAAQQQFPDFIKNDLDQDEQQQPTQNTNPENEQISMPIKPSQIKDQLYQYFNDDSQPIDQQNWSLQLGDLSHPKSKKVREMVNKNTELIKQKKELNNILPC